MEKKYLAGIFVFMLLAGQGLQQYLLYDDMVTYSTHSTYSTCDDIMTFMMNITTLLPHN